MKKLFYLCIGLLLVGCGKNKVDDTLISNDENTLNCTSVTRNILFNDDYKEYWKYSFNYSEDHKSINGIKEIYIVNEDATTEEVTDKFCKSRITYMLGDYDNNKDLCKVNIKDKTITAVITYNDKMIERYSKMYSSMDELKTGIESGKTESGFRDTFICDNSYDPYNLKETILNDKEFKVKYSGDISDMGDVLISSMTRIINSRINVYKMDYKIDIYNKYNITLKETNNNIYTYNITFNCLSNDTDNCKKAYDKLLSDAVDGLKFYNAEIIK